MMQTPIMNRRPSHPARTGTDARVRTLVVDDSPMMLKILAQVLGDAGNFDLIGTATDGCQALRHVSELSPDLVVMDVHMPQLNGIQATDYIKHRECPPRVIIVTSDDSAVTRSMAEKAGADGLVLKQGDLRLRLTGTLHKLFGPHGSRRRLSCGSSRQRPPAAQAKQDRHL